MEDRKFMYERQRGICLFSFSHLVSHTKLVPNYNNSRLVQIGSLCKRHIKCGSNDGINLRVVKNHCRKRRISES